MTAYRIRTASVTLLLLASTAVVSSVWAQSSSEESGVQLRFGLGLGIDSKSNRSLSTDNPGTSTEAYADLSFGLSSETRTQSLNLDLSGRLRNVNAPDSFALDDGFTTPSARLSYSRSGATSKLNLSARLAENDLSDSSLLIDDDGSFNIIAGDATRRTRILEAGISWNEDARISYGAFVRHAETSFRGGTVTDVDGSTLNDSERLTLGADATLNLSRAARLNVALSYSDYTQDSTSTDRDTWSLDNTLTLDRPTGEVVFSLGVTDTEEGTRFSTAAGRTYTLPQATLFGEIGATREVSGGTALTGQLSVEYPLPRGALNFGLSRNVSSSNIQDEERLNTQINLGYQQALTALSNLNIDMIWAEATDTSSERSFRDGTLSVSYTRTLTEDWNMNLGVRHRYSDDDGIGTARSNEVFMSMSRSYLTRF